MLIDTHAHLNMRDYQDDLGEVLRRARDAEVGVIINIGYDLESSQEAVELAREHDFLWAAVGFHPHDADRLTDEGMEALRELAADKKVVAIGETGLDFYRDLSPRDIQRKAFRRHISLAKEVDLPLVVHLRNAQDEGFNILKQEAVSQGIMHCFSGNREQAREAVGLGFYLGFDGPLTYDSPKLISILKDTPGEKILLETDCPYLTPKPHRGKRNEPSYLRFICEKASSELGISYEDLAGLTTANARTLFGANL